MPLLPSPMSLHKHWQQVPLGKSRVKETANPGGLWAHHGKNSKTTGQRRQKKTESDYKYNVALERGIKLSEL